MPMFISEASEQLKKDKEAKSTEPSEPSGEGEPQSITSQGSVEAKTAEAIAKKSPSVAERETVAVA